MGFEGQIKLLDPPPLHVAAPLEAVWTCEVLPPWEKINFGLRRNRNPHSGPHWQKQKNGPRIGKIAPKMAFRAIRGRFFFSWAIVCQFFLMRPIRFRPFFPISGGGPKSIFSQVGNLQVRTQRFVFALLFLAWFFEQHALLCLNMSHVAPDQARV